MGWDGEHPTEAVLPILLPIPPGAHPAPAGQPPGPKLQPRSLPDSRAPQEQPGRSGSTASSCRPTSHRPVPTRGRGEGCRGTLGRVPSSAAGPRFAPGPAPPSPGLPGRVWGRSPARPGPGPPSCLPGPDPASHGVWCPPVEQQLRRDAAAQPRHHSHAPSPCTAAMHRSRAPQPSSIAVPCSHGPYPRTVAVQWQPCTAGHAPRDERRAARARVRHVPGKAAKAGRAMPGAAASHDPHPLLGAALPISAGTGCSALCPVGFCLLRTITVPCQAGSKLQAAQGTMRGAVCGGVRAQHAGWPSAA